MRDRLAIGSVAMILAGCIIGCIGCDVYSDDDTTTTETYTYQADGTLIVTDGNGNTTEVINASAEIEEE